MAVICPNCKREGRVSLRLKGKFNIYYCDKCLNGFTYPTPKNIQNYYPAYYWKNLSLLGKVKNILFNILQRRRILCIKKTIKKGNILDVGSGEGRYFSMLPSTYNLVRLEPPGSKVQNKSVIKKDFLSWKTNLKYDVVCFWESLEHTPEPQRYLTKAYGLIKKKGKVLVEIPRYNSIESKIFGKYWFHLDLPRHLAHLTDGGIVVLLKRSGFKNIKVKKVTSFDYTPWGLLASLLNGFSLDITDYFKKSGNFPLFILITPLIFICFTIEFILTIFQQSPIILATAEK